MKTTKEIVAERAAVLFMIFSDAMNAQPGNAYCNDFGNLEGRQRNAWKAIARRQLLDELENDH